MVGRVNVGTERRRNKKVCSDIGLNMDWKQGNRRVIVLVGFDVMRTELKMCMVEIIFDFEKNVAFRRRGFAGSVVGSLNVFEDRIFEIRLLLLMYTDSLCSIVKTVEEAITSWINMMRDRNATHSARNEEGR